MPESSSAPAPAGSLPRPACVVFDLGKVLVDFDYSIAARRLAGGSRLDVAGIRALIDQAPLLLRYERGEMSTGEFFEAFVDGTDVLDLTSLPAGQAFDLLFDEDPSAP